MSAVLEKKAMKEMKWLAFFYNNYYYINTRTMTSRIARSIIKSVLSKEQMEGDGARGKQL